ARRGADRSPAGGTTPTHSKFFPNSWLPSSAKPFMKLLVVEDEPSLLNSIIRYFRQEQFICEGVSNYTEALQRVEDTLYDCIILDINLPGGSGLQLLKWLRE